VGELGWMLRLSGTTSRAGRQWTEVGFGAETRGHGLESTGADAEIACREKEAAALRNKRSELALGLQAPGGFLWWRARCMGAVPSEAMATWRHQFAAVRRRQ
jgi:hypothetical protein